MDEQGIKNLRHSFTTSKKEESGKISKNQFGHTILGEENLLDVAHVKLMLNENGELEANSEGWLENDELILKLSDSLNVEGESPLSVQNLIESQKSTIQPHIEGRSIYTELMSELDDLANSNAGIKKPVSSGFNGCIRTDLIVKTDLNDDHLKTCFNKDCLYHLPKDAKFCLKCGTAQMLKFCTECGYQFPGAEKFCPECGTKR
jgi:RNA polymerase subunit RPABC4/transcription elongation factor Spt4